LGDSSNAKKYLVLLRGSGVGNNRSWFFTGNFGSKQAASPTSACEQSSRESGA
jgi:hypothetical protein